MTQQEVFNQNLAALNAYIEERGALITGTDESGDYTLIDPTKVPAPVLDAYRGLLSFGYANGLL